eukprot:644964-Prymnesium_polylepis.1
MGSKADPKNKKIVAEAEKAIEKQLAKLAGLQKTKGCLALTCPERGVGCGFTFAAGSAGESWGSEGGGSCSPPTI